MMLSHLIYWKYPQENFYQCAESIKNWISKRENKHDALLSSPFWATLYLLYKEGTISVTDGNTQLLTYIYLQINKLHIKAVIILKGTKPRN
jgi:hypothetical protein